jgi:peroxiredoxin/glutaredoxin
VNAVAGQDRWHDTRIVREGSQVPQTDLFELRDRASVRIHTNELFAGRRVILFALPGAFTPTCSTAHVPGYVAEIDNFHRAGIEEVICLSVNDPFVMAAWQRSEKARGIRFMADPRAEFTQAMGVAIDQRDLPLGLRSWRYSMLVDDGIIKKMFIEPDKPGDPLEVSDAETMLQYLQPNRKRHGPVLVLARHGCPYCERAKGLLRQQQFEFEIGYVGDELSMRGVKAATGKATVPQVFIDGQLVGGADQLERYFATLQQGSAAQASP